MPHDTHEEISILKSESTTVQLSNLQEAVEFSLKVSDSSSFLIKERSKTSIASVILLDAKSWIQIFESYPEEIIKYFFSKCPKATNFAYYLGSILQYYQSCTNKELKDQDIVNIIHLICHSNQNILNFVCMFLPKLDRYLVSKYTLPFTNINEFKTIADACLSLMLEAKDEYKLEQLYCILYGCSKSCQDVYDIVEQFSSQTSNNVNSNLQCMLSIMTPEIVLDLFCLKSPSGISFGGQINGHSWFYQVSDSGLFSIISTELTKKYVPQNHSSKFVSNDKFDNKSSAVDCIANIKSKLNHKTSTKFDSIHFHQVLYAFSNSCQNVYDIINDDSINRLENISSR